MEKWLRELFYIDSRYFIFVYQSFNCRVANFRLKVNRIDGSIQHCLVVNNIVLSSGRHNRPLDVLRLEHRVCAAFLALAQGLALLVPDFTLGALVAEDFDLTRAAVDRLIRLVLVECVDLNQQRHSLIEFETIILMTTLLLCLFEQRNLLTNS